LGLQQVVEITNGHAAPSRIRSFSGGAFACIISQDCSAKAAM
jgi:hypothetical protein